MVAIETAGSQRFDDDPRMASNRPRQAPAGIPARPGGKWRFPIAPDTGADDPLSYLRLLCTRSLAHEPFGFVLVETTPAELTAGEVVASALGVTAGGAIEALGLDAGDGGDREFWFAFFEGLIARGLHGVEGVCSAPFRGLDEAVSALFPGAVWLHADDDGTVAGAASPKYLDGVPSGRGGE